MNNNLLSLYFVNISCCCYWLNAVVYFSLPCSFVEFFLWVNTVFTLVSYYINLLQYTLDVYGFKRLIYLSLYGLSARLDIGVVGVKR